MLRSQSQSQDEDRLHDRAFPSSYPAPSSSHHLQFLQSQSPNIIHVPQSDAQANQTGLVISKIEDIFASMVDVLAQEGDGDGDALSIPYRSRASAQQAPGALKFPGSSVHEATKFTRMMRIMELSREALVSDRPITKRNIYYQNPALFKKQAVVDQLVDDLAFTLGVGRAALNIVAASKGLVAGPIRLFMKDDTVISCSADHDKNDLIPPISMIQQIDFAETRWILVIEKEATFRTLAASQYWRTCIHGQGVIVTGKGYADLATLQFLNLIHRLRPLIPMLCIVDCDPHGIDIMRKYKYGSRSLGHEVNAQVPGLHWLGVKMDDILGHKPPLVDGNSAQSSFSNSSQSSGAHSSQTSWSFAMPEPLPSTRPRATESRCAADLLTSLTPNDRKTAQRIFGDMMASDRELGHEETEQLRELQVMLMLDMKAGIQAIDDMGDLSAWLDDKLGMA